MNSSANFEKRSGVDRRKRDLPILSKYWMTGRRGELRRVEDRQKSHRIDRYSPKTLFAILLIIALCILDVFFTLVLVSHGAKEINPLMAYYLDRSPLLFFGVKYMLTCASIILILFNKNVYLFKTKVQVKIVFVFLLFPLALVVHWQLYLLFFVL